MLGLYAVAFGGYFAALMGFDENSPWRTAFASAVVVLFTVLNMAKAQIIGMAESVLVYFKLTVLLIFCASGLMFVDPSQVSPAHYPALGTIVYAGALIFLGYEGFELIANAAEDARDPRRSLPRAYLIAIGSVIALYVLVAFVAVGNLTAEQIEAERDYALAAAARPFLGAAGFTLIAVAAVVSTTSAINATLYGTARFTSLMAERRELPIALAKPLWRRPVGGLFVTALSTLLIINTVDLTGISLAGSAGFLLIFAAVNTVAVRLHNSWPVKVAAGAGALACLGCFSALLWYAAHSMPDQLWAFGVLITVAALVSIVLRWHASRTHQRV